MIFGVMFLGFALVGWLDSVGGNGLGGLLQLAAVLGAAWGVGHWINGAVLRHAVWPRVGYAGPRRDLPTVPGVSPPRRTKLTWALIAATGGAALTVTGLAVFSPRQEAMGISPELLGGVLGIVIFVGLTGSYALWFCFNGWREYPWKWLILLVLTLGLAAIWAPVGGDYLEVWPRVMLFNGIVWLASGVATLCSYLRHPKPPALGAE